MSEKIIINGTITCTSDDLAMVVSAVKDHIRLSNAEPGCELFSIEQSVDDPCVFLVSERFVDQAASDAHSARTRASAWWEMTRHIPRDLKISKA